MARRLDWDAIVPKVCEIMRSGKSVRSAAKTLKVDRGTLLEKLASPEYADQYARARAMQAHVLAEEVLAVADDMTIPDAHKRVMVDARKWYASKLAPKVYGEKVTQELVGEVKHEHRGSVRIAGMDIPL